MTIRQFVGMFSEINRVINLESGGKGQPMPLEGRAATSYMEKLANKNLKNKAKK